MPSPSGPVRVRFAPSPTGLLHIGGLRTALYNYLVARKHGGAFILRIEDTDRARFVPEAERDILESLRWAGLEVDEGPEQGGPHAPYRQSERTACYREAADRLLAEGHAYIAFDTPEALEALRAGGRAYDASTRGQMDNALTRPAEEVAARVAAGEPHVVRLRVPPGERVTFEDLIRGPVAFDTDGIDDQILLKSDGLPTYHLANVVDDHHMEITHVIRGEEWLPSVPKHLLLYRALGWAPPAMAHLPLILSPTGGKLSKRNAESAGIPVSVRQYREAGYEPEALLNFLAFLGWNPGTDEEVFALDGLVEAYSLERTGQSAVQFNLDKLRWYNGQHLRRKSPGALARAARPYLDAAGLPYTEPQLLAAAALMHDRLEFAHDLATEGAYLFRDPEVFDEAAVRKRWKEDAPELVSAYADRLEALPELTEEAAEAALRALAEERGVGAGRIIHPVRVAVSGTMAGPGLFELLAVLGREVTLRRLRRAAATLR